MTCGSSPIDQVPNRTASSQATDDSQRKRCSWQTQPNTSDKHHCFQSLAKHSDKRQQKHSILFTPLLKPRASTPLDLPIILLQRQRNLHAPFILQLRHAEQRRAHHRDDNCSEQAEDTLPDVFGAGEVVFAKAVEGADQAAADDEANREPESDADPDLLDEAFIDDLVALGAQGLFEEGEEDGDDDAGFEAFAEADEEDCSVLISGCWRRGIG